MPGYANVSYVGALNSDRSKRWPGLKASLGISFSLPLRAPRGTVHRYRCAYSGDHSMPTHTEGGHSAIVEALHIELDALTEAESKAKEAAAEAKATLDSKRAERRQVERALRMFTNGDADSITKKTLKPLLEQALQKGPVAEQELRNRLETVLKSKGKSTSGLGLILSKLRASYTNDQGQWTLPEPGKQE